MNRGSVIFRVILTLVLVAVVAGIGVFAYNAGMAQGLAQKLPAAAITAPATGTFVYQYPGMMPFGGPFGMHAFGFLGCLVPFFLLFLFFGVMRALIWHGPHRWRGHHGMGRWGEDGILPHLEELHQRMHDKQAEKPDAK